MPHIQIRFLGKKPVFRYEFLVLFSHPCCWRVTCLGRLLLMSPVALRQVLQRFLRLGRIGMAHSQQGILPNSLSTGSKVTASISLARDCISLICASCNILCRAVVLWIWRQYFYQCTSWSVHQLIHKYMMVTLASSLRHHASVGYCEDDSCEKASCR